jgi:hypothetical protein
MTGTIQPPSTPRNNPETMQVISAPSLVDIDFGLLPRMGTGDGTGTVNGTKKSLHVWGAALLAPDNAPTGSRAPRAYRHRLLVRSDRGIVWLRANKTKKRA